MRRFLTVLAVFAVAGCTPGTPAPKPAPTGLVKLVAAFATTSYKFKVTANDGSYSGGVDPVKDTLTSTITVSSPGMSMSVDTMGDSGTYVTRIGGSPLPGMDGKTWYRVDAAKMSEAGALGISSTKDPTGIRPLVAAVTEAQQTGDAWKGTVDLTHVAHWGPISPETTEQLGDAAKSVPFEATVDGQGRLTKMTVQLPGNAVTALYTDFGSAVPVTMPPNPPPLPDSLYSMVTS
jgi:hypothetical protein